MPRATISQATEKFDLASLTDGYVVLKRRNYGDQLKRRDMIMLFNAKQGAGKDVDITTEMQNRKVTEFEWAASIVEWNLTDENDVLLDWRKANIFDIIDPVIATEISRLIDDLHDFEDELGK